MENKITILKKIYENELGKKIEDSDFRRGGLIEKLKIDSLVALQIIVGIEKKFDYVIEDDDIAIKVVDTPLKFLRSEEHTSELQSR